MNEDVVDEVHGIRESEGQRVRESESQKNSVISLL